MRARRLSGSLTAAALVAVLAAFAYHARIYWTWTEDDAFITFRYAQNLARGEGLVFNPGERVEGYSNFSWVLLAAAALRSGRDPVVVAKIAGLVAGLASIVLAWALARRMAPRAGLAALLAPIYLATSPVLVLHAIAGLETSAFAMLLAAGVLLSGRKGGAAGRGAALLVALLLALTRPEGAALGAILVGRRLLAPGGRRSGWVDLGLFAILYGAYHAWRWSYFGAPLPNTYYAKAQGGLHGIIDGMQYTLDFLRDAGGPLFVGLALVPAVLVRGGATYGTALACLALYVGFVVVAGGDWMFHYRFYAHVLPVLAAAIAAGLDQLLALPRPGSARAVAAYAGLALVLLATHLSVGNTELRVARLVLPALKQHNYLSQNYAELGRWFQEHTPEGTTIAISDVGAVGYYSDRRILDMFGLIDPHIARLRGRMHYKADPKYVLSRRPQYIVLVSLNDEGAGYSFQRIPDYSMHAQPAFHASYELVRTVPQYWQNEFVLVFRRHDDAAEP